MIRLGRGLQEAAAPVSRLGRALAHRHLTHRRALVALVPDLGDESTVSSNSVPSYPKIIRWNRNGKIFLFPSLSRAQNDESIAMSSIDDFFFNLGISIKIPSD